VQADEYFVAEVAALLGIWGVPQTPGRLFAHLLLQQQPASLDAIASELDVGKTTASDAAKLMERYGFLRRFGTPGSKRATYGPSDDFTAFYLKQAAYLIRMGRVMDAQADNDPALPSSKRLRAMAEYYGRLAKAMNAISDEYIGP
jgi:DNA-binding transcriptional regulator GbsR (MarR family)